MGDRRLRLSKADLTPTRQASRGVELTAKTGLPSPSHLDPSQDRHQPRIGIVHNVRARHNLGRHLPRVVPGCDHVMPKTLDELRAVLIDFAAAQLDAIIVDGGDGTVRDILSVIARNLPGFRPRIAIVPSGKTNALALDLGMRRDWTLAQAIEAVARGRIVARGPIEIWRDGADHAEHAGFIFGGGAFVRATQTAQQTHRLGAFNGLAVGLSIMAAVAQTIFGGKNNVWRRGKRMRISVDGDKGVDAPHYFILASSLTRMPLDIRPFGSLRPGLKMLRIESPAPRLAYAAPIILAGRDPQWLRKAGYHRSDARRIDIAIDGDFVLDGETFEGGELSLRHGAPISFIVP